MRDGDYLNLVSKLSEDEEVGEVAQMQAPDAKALGDSRDKASMRACGPQVLKSYVD